MSGIISVEGNIENVSGMFLFPSNSVAALEETQSSWFPRYYCQSSRALYFLCYNISMMFALKKKGLFLLFGDFCCDPSHLTNKRNSCRVFCC